MSAIQEIQEKLNKYPGLGFELESNSISVLPENGFTVWLTENESSYTVGYDGWHEDFDSKEEALNCFAFGLSSECRLKIHKFGDSPYKWVVQYREAGEWLDDSTTGLVFVPFWRSRNIEYLQNAVTNS